MKKLFKWLLLLAAALAIVIVLLLYNPGLFKGPLESYLSKLTGFSISLAGELEISTGRKTALTVTNLHIANPEWAGDGELVTVGYLSLVLDSSSLFESVVIIESLQIDDLTVSPETNAEGVGNWVITQSPQSPQPSQPGGGTDASAVFFKDIKLNNATVRYLNGETGATQELLIVSLDQQQRDNGMLDFKLDGTFNGRRVEYAGSVGPFANLVAGRDIAFTGNGHFGSLNIRGEGLIDDLLEPRQPKFNIELQGPDIDEITAMLGVNDLGAGSFSLKARGESIDGRYETGIHGSIGDVSLQVSAQASDLVRLDDVDLKLAANGPSLGALTRALGVENWPDKPFSLKGEVKRVGTTLNVSRLTFNIGGTQIMLDALLTNFPAFDASRVRLSLKGDDVAQFRELLGISGIATGPFEIVGKLDVSADEVELIQLDVKTSLGQATLAGTLGPGPSYLGTKLHVNLHGQDAHLLLSAAGIDALPQQSFMLDAHIELVEKGLLIERGVLVLSDDDRLELEGIELTAEGLIVPAGNFAGTNVRFSVQGSDLARLLAGQVSADLLPGPFEAAGQVTLSNDTLGIKGLSFETLKAQGEIDLELGWPVAESNDINFNVNVRGDDVRHFFPQTEAFEPAMLAYNIKAAGLRKGELISLRHFEAGIGNLQVSLQGNVDSGPGNQNVAIAFSAIAEDISALGKLNGEPLPAMAMDLRADFNGNASEFTIRNLEGSLGESRFGGSLYISLQGTKAVFNLDVNSPLLDVRPFQAIDQHDDDDEKTGGDPGGDRMITAIPLPLDALASLNGNFKINIGELIRRQGSIRNLVLEAVVEAGGLEIKRLDFEGLRGKLKSSLTIIPFDTDKADVKLDLSAEKFVLNLTGQAQKNLARLPAFDVEIHASGRGRDLQELAGSLNGSLLLGSEGGTLEGVNLSILDTFILDEIFNLIMPKTDAVDDLDLSCAAAIVKFVNGKMETSPALAFTTSRIVLIANGTLDLKTEEMEFNFNATPRKALQISAGELFNPYILVGGTLSQPAVSLDPAKVLLYGGAAIGTAGISILAKGLLDRMGNAASLCDEMLAEVQQ